MIMIFFKQSELSASDLFLDLILMQSCYCMRELL